MNERRRRWEQLPTIRAVLVGAVTDQQHEVRTFDHTTQTKAPRASSHHVANDSHAQRMPFVHHPFAHRGCGDRQIGHVADRRQCVISPRQMHAAPGNDDRISRCGKQAGDLLDCLRIRLGSVQRIHAETGLPWRGGRRVLGQQVGRDEDDRGTGTSRRSGGECHVDVIFEAVCSIDAPHPFGHRRKHIEMIEFLERVPVRRCAGDLLHQRHDWNGRFQRLRQRRHQQGRGRPILSCDHANATGNPRIAISHGAAGIFLPICSLPDPDLRRREVKGAGQALAERDGNAVTGESLRQTEGDVAVGCHGPLLFANRYRVAKPSASIGQSRQRHAGRLRPGRRQANNAFRNLGSRSR